MSTTKQAHSPTEPDRWPMPGVSMPDTYKGRLSIQKADLGLTIISEQGDRVFVPCSGLNQSASLNAPELVRRWNAAPALAEALQDMRSLAAKLEEKLLDLGAIDEEDQKGYDLRHEKARAALKGAGQ